MIMGNLVKFAYVNDKLGAPNFSVYFCGPRHTIWEVEIPRNLDLQAT